MRPPEFEAQQRTAPSRGAAPDFHRLFEAAPGLYLVLLPDAPRFSIAAVSDAYARATMTRREQILGRGIFEVFPDNPGDPDADGERNLLASLQRALDTGQPDAMAVQKYDIPRPAEAGGDFEERWWSPLNTPVLDDEGRVVYLIHRVEDVTGFMRLQRAGAEQERKAAELRDRTRLMEVEIYQRAQEIQATNERLRAANAEVSRLHEKSLELDRLKSDFFAAVSHELRTPLTLILGPVRKLLADAPPGSQAQGELEIVQRNARTLLDHVNDLLDISKLEAGRLTPDYARVDVAALARAACGHFEALARELGDSLVVDTPPTLQAQADPQLLQRVLLNLLSNAFKFTPAGGTVRLTLREQGPRLLLEVADSGPGIPETMREVVFDRFRQLDSGLQRRFGGTGLGLAIVREFVSLHGGTVVALAAPEGGALMRADLPRHAPAGTPVSDASALPGFDTPPPGPAQTMPSPEPGATAEGAGALVLVVEDNADLNRFICNGLAPDYRVSRCGNGSDALALARRLQPHVIVTDLMMPGLGGEELLRELRQNATTQSTPVLVLSAKADDGLRVRLLRGGAQDYLVKPFTIEELRARVGNLAARRAAVEAAQAAAAQLEQRVAERTEDLRRLAAELEAAENRERRKLARDLHDDLGQTLAAARIRLAALCGSPQPEVRAIAAQVDELVDRANRSTRSLASQLAPAILFELGLAPALEWLGEEIERGFGLKVRVRDDGQPKPMPPATRSVLYRAARELLINAAKHARVDHAEIGLECQAGRAVVRISDAGVGFDPSTITIAPGQGLGLISVRERLAFVGGTADIHSIPGDGTVATLTVPLAAGPASQEVS